MCVFTRNDVHFNPRSGLKMDGLEVAWVDILLPKCRPILVGVSYRSPKQNNIYDFS